MKPEEPRSNRFDAATLRSILNTVSSLTSSCARPPSPAVITCALLSTLYPMPMLLYSGTCPATRHRTARLVLSRPAIWLNRRREEAVRGWRWGCRFRGMKHRSSNQRISKGQFAYYLLTLLIIAGRVANAQNSPGVIRGAIVTIESDGSRSMIPGATVVVESAEGARQTTADNVGSYTFADLPAGRYQIRASAPGLVGSTFAEINSGESLDVEIPMAIENVKLSDYRQRERRTAHLGGARAAN